MTRDVDITLVCPFGSESGAIERLLAAFRPRVEDARGFALRNRVVLLWSAKGIAVDIALGALPFEERCVRRASDWELAPRVVLHTCCAEDLVTLKVFAGRPQDWVDVERVLVRQRRSLDWHLIESELAPLLAAAEAPEKLDRLKALRRKVESRR